MVEDYNVEDVGYDANRTDYETQVHMHDTIGVSEVCETWHGVVVACVRLWVVLRNRRREVEKETWWRSHQRVYLSAVGSRSGKDKNKEKRRNSEREGPQLK